MASGRGDVTSNSRRDTVGLESLRNKFNAAPGLTLLLDTTMRRDWPDYFKIRIDVELKNATSAEKLRALTKKL